MKHDPLLGAFKWHTLNLLSLWSIKINFYGLTWNNWQIIHTIKVHWPTWHLVLKENKTFDHQTGGLPRSKAAEIKIALWRKNEFKAWQLLIFYYAYGLVCREKPAFSFFKFLFQYLITDQKSYRDFRETSLGPLSHPYFPCKHYETFTREGFKL